MGRTSEAIIAMEDALVTKAQLADNGEAGFAETFISMHNDRKGLERCIGMIKDWTSQHQRNILDENDEIVQYRDGGLMYDFKPTPRWQELHMQLKEVEERAKEAYRMKQKGMLPVTEDGEMIDLPEVKQRKSSLIVKR